MFGDMNLSKSKYIFLKWPPRLLTFHVHSQGHRVKFEVAVKNCWKSFWMMLGIVLARCWPVTLTYKVNVKGQFHENTISSMFVACLVIEIIPSQSILFKITSWPFDLQGHGQGHRVKFKVMDKIYWKSFWKTPGSVLTWVWPVTLTLKVKGQIPNTKISFNQKLLQSFYHDLRRKCKWQPPF